MGPFFVSGLGEVYVLFGDGVLRVREVGLHFWEVDFGFAGWAGGGWRWRWGRRWRWGGVRTAGFEGAGVDAAAAAEIVDLADVEGCSGFALRVVAGGEGGWEGGG